MPMNPGPIKIMTGTFSNECVAQYDLIANQANFPQIRDYIEYVQQRQCTTLFTSGAITPYGIKYNAPTRVPNVETKGRAIGADAYQFRIMGRLEATAPILGQVGTSDTNGAFTLKMQDNILNKGDNVTFYGGRKMARVMAGPRPSAGGFLYDFQTPSREVFDYSTWVAPQSGTKFCFAYTTTFGEQSLRGYGYSKFPDMFINHMTIQRQSISITGDANTQVLWINYMGSNGIEGKGWMFEEIRQLKAKLAYQDERAKIWGVSSMKNTDGTLATVSNLTDPETGRPIIQGDGIEEQIAAGNVIYGTGVNGVPIIDNYIDMMAALQLKGNMVSGYNWMFVMGTVGFYNFQTECVAHLGNQNVQLMQAVNNDGSPMSTNVGGTDVAAGYTFYKINFAGNTITACIHPMFDDPLFASEIAANGKSVLSQTIFVLPLGNGADMNMEVLHKAAFGVDRNLVEATLNGMTGAPEAVITQEDAKTFAALKQSMINIYNTQICGIIYPG